MLTDTVTTDEVARLRTRLAAVAERANRTSPDQLAPGIKTEVAEQLAPIEALLETILGKSVADGESAQAGMVEVVDRLTGVSAADLDSIEETLGADLMLKLLETKYGSGLGRLRAKVQDLNDYRVAYAAHYAAHHDDLTTAKPFGGRLPTLTAVLGEPEAGEARFEPVTWTTGGDVNPEGHVELETTYDPRSVIYGVCQRTRQRVYVTPLSCPMPRYTRTRAFEPCVGGGATRVVHFCVARVSAEG